VPVRAHGGGEGRSHWRAGETGHLGRRWVFALPRSVHSLAPRIARPCACRRSHVERPWPDAGLRGIVPAAGGVPALGVESEPVCDS